MKIRLFTFALILLVSAPFVTAQKTSFGILGGVNFQNLNGKDYFGDNLENQIKTGFHAGLNIQIPVVPDFYLQPGLLFSTKGCRDTESSEDMKINISYLELPVNLVYKLLVGKGHFMLGFGPYLGYGVSGKLTFGDESEDIEFKNKIEALNGVAMYLRPFDAGANIFAGYELPVGLFFQLNAQLGLLNINPDYEGEGTSEDKSSLKNTGFSLSAGYRF